MMDVWRAHASRYLPGTNRSICGTGGSKRHMSRVKEDEAIFKNERATVLLGRGEKHGTRP